jgi:hypothetical protein
MLRIGKSSKCSIHVRMQCLELVGQLVNLNAGAPPRFLSNSSMGPRGVLRIPILVASITTVSFPLQVDSGSLALLA